MAGSATAMEIAPARAMGTAERTWVRRTTASRDMERLLLRESYAMAGATHWRRPFHHTARAAAAPTACAAQAPALRPKCSGPLESLHREGEPEAASTFTGAISSERCRLQRLSLAGRP